MASKKFNIGDRVKYIADGEERRGTVCEPNAVDGTGEFGFSDVAVWARWDYDDFGPGWMPESRVTLVVEAADADGWRTVTEEQKQFLEELLNGSVEFRIQVRVRPGTTA